jgi:hypothetical protein
MKKSTAFCILLLFAIILAACGGAASPNDAGDSSAANAVEESAPGENLAEPAADLDLPGIDDFSVVYGIDERFESCPGCALTEEVDDVALSELGASVAVLVRPAAIFSLEAGAYAWNAFTLEQRLAQLYDLPLCAEERFAQQLAPGFCTGFLLDEQHLITARHCIPNAELCADTRVVFDFQVNANGQLIQPGADNLFWCAGIETESAENDYVIISLTQPTGRPGLPLDTAASGAVVGPLAIIGHPDGLPRKVAIGASILADDPAEPYFVTDLDAFAGNSGSPVVDLSSYQVVGMLMGGAADYERTAQGCLATHVCDPALGECSGEAVLRTSVFASWLTQP